MVEEEDHGKTAAAHMATVAATTDTHVGATNATFIGARPTDQRLRDFNVHAFQSTYGSHLHSRSTT